MEVVILLRQAAEIGLRLQVNGDTLVVRGPHIPGVEKVVDQLRQHKPEIITYLKQLKTVQGKPKEWHAEEVARLVEKEGICIFWSDLFRELVAFVKDDSRYVPAGIVTYSTDEIETLFGKKELSPGALRLIHEAKKIGGHVSND